MEFKRGDTFDFLARFNPEESPPGTWVGWTVTCQVRSGNLTKLYGSLTCTWLDPATTQDLHLFLLDTSTWLLGPAVLDIQFRRSSDNYVRSTNTIMFEVIADVTQP